MSKVIIDSQLGLKEALAQNPDRPCPEDILQSLTLKEVHYRGFDDLEHAGQIVVARGVEADVDNFFTMAYKMKFPIEKVVLAADKRYEWNDEKLMADNASSGFNYRLIAGSDKPSLHGRGLAFDINTRINPYIRREAGKNIVQPPGAIWDKDAPGALHGQHPLVLLMEDLGWVWGGRWTLEGRGMVDYQHFEKAS